MTSKKQLNVHRIRRARLLFTSQRISLGPLAANTSGQDTDEIHAVGHIIYYGFNTIYIPEMYIQPKRSISMCLSEAQSAEHAM